VLKDRRRKRKKRGRNATDRGLWTVSQAVRREQFLITIIENTGCSHNSRREAPPPSLAVPVRAPPRFSWLEIFVFRFDMSFADVASATLPWLMLKVAPPTALGDGGPALLKSSLASLVWA
jgi:hypothetical protein